jgi:hypothetical protein
VESRKRAVVVLLVLAPGAEVKIRVLVEVAMLIGVNTRSVKVLPRKRIQMTRQQAQLRKMALS